MVLLRVRDGKMLINTLYFHSEIQQAPVVEKSKLTITTIVSIPAKAKPIESPFLIRKNKTEDK